MRDGGAGVGGLWAGLMVLGPGAVSLFFGSYLRSFQLCVRD